MQTRWASRIRTIGFLLLLASVLSVVVGGVVIAHGLDLRKTANKPWTSLIPSHECRRDRTTTRCSAVDQDGQPLTMLIVDRPGGGAYLYAIRPGRDRSNVVMATGESLLLVGLSTLILGVSRIRSGTTSNPWRRRTWLLALATGIAIPLFIVLSIPPAPGQSQLASTLLIGIYGLGIGTLTFALLTVVARKSVRIGAVTLPPAELATAAALIKGKITSADDRTWIAATEIARRRLSQPIAPVMTALLLLAWLPLVLIAALATPSAWSAAVFNTILLIMTFELLRRNRVHARRFFSTHRDDITRVETQGAAIPPISNDQAATIDQGTAPDAAQPDVHPS